MYIYPLTNGCFSTPGRYLLCQYPPIPLQAITLFDAVLLIIDNNVSVL